jgi:hypothetical protein
MRYSDFKEYKLDHKQIFNLTIEMQLPGGMTNNYMVGFIDRLISILLNASPLNPNDQILEPDVLIAVNTLKDLKVLIPNGDYDIKSYSDFKD